MSSHELLWKIRAKRLGVALQAARKAAGKNLRECAEQVGLSTRVLRAYERGSRAPSLPELAVLARCYRVPLSFFWRTELTLDGAPGKTLEDVQAALEQYHQHIAWRLREAREAKGWSLAQLARVTGLSRRKLKNYEGGEPIPVPELETLVAALDLSLHQLFQEAPGPLGQWIRQQQRLESFLSLPEELQDFVAKPVNRPYLEIALRLSQLPVERLRAVAEGLLEITL